MGKITKPQQMLPKKVVQRFQNLTKLSLLFNLIVIQLLLSLSYPIQGRSFALDAVSHCALSLLCTRHEARTTYRRGRLVQSVVLPLPLATVLALSLSHTASQRVCHSAECRVIHLCTCSPILCTYSKTIKCSRFGVMSTLTRSHGRKHARARTC